MTRGATTDARGVYHYRLPPGETYFYVIGPPSGYTRLADDGSSRTVNIPTNGAHFSVPPIAVIGAVTLRGASSTGGRPIIGAKIVGTCEGNLCMPFPGKETFTDARGEFHLPEGSYNTVARGQSAALDSATRWH